MEYTDNDTGQSRRVVSMFMWNLSQRCGRIVIYRVSHGGKKGVTGSCFGKWNEKDKVAGGKG
jgi:hypothetical protein